MESLEPKKTALIRIWQILKEYSDYEHPMKQEDIAKMLESDYGIVIERKAISRNISLLNEIGIEIEARGKSGSYLVSRDFEDAELHLLIDGVLCSKHISANNSKDLIKRICGLSNKYFRSNVKNIHSVNDWNKTDNQELFYNIETIDIAIEEGKQIYYNYNKFGIDKKLHKSSHQYVSPYLMILHNQRYYLMAYSEYWGNMVFHRLDHITKMTVTDKTAIPIKQVPGYENGINYQELSSAMPYMYADKPERIELTADAAIIDQIVDWFGSKVTIMKGEEEKRIKVSIIASPSAMKHWAMQYIDFVEVTSPAELRENIKKSLENGMGKYK